MSLEGAALFVDVDESTFNIDPIALEKAIQEVINGKLFNPKVIVTVDLFELPANYSEIRENSKQI